MNVKKVSAIILCAAVGASQAASCFAESSLSAIDCFAVENPGVSSGLVDFNDFITNTNASNAVLNNYCWQAERDGGRINDFLAVKGKFGKNSSDTSVYLKKNPGVYNATDIQGNGQGYFPFLLVTPQTTTNVAQNGSIVLSVDFALQNDISSLYIAPNFYNDSQNLTRKDLINITSSKITLGVTNIDLKEADVNIQTGVWHRLDVVITAGQESDTSTAFGSIENPNTASVYIDGKAAIENSPFDGVVNKNQYKQICGVKDVRIGYKYGSANTRQVFPNMGTYIDNVCFTTWQSGLDFESIDLDSLLPVSSDTTIGEYKEAYNDYQVKVRDSEGNEITDETNPVSGYYTELSDTTTGSVFYKRPYVTRDILTADYNEENIFPAILPTGFTQHGMDSTSTFSSVSNLDTREDKCFMITSSAAGRDQNVQIYNKDNTGGITIVDGEKVTIEFSMYLADFNSRRTVMAGTNSFLHIYADGTVKSEQTSLTKIKNTGWYKFAVEFTGNSSKYDLYMNGVKIGSDLSLLNNVVFTQYNKIRFVMSTADAVKASSTALDDIKIYCSNDSIYKPSRDAIVMSGAKLDTDNKWIVLSEKTDNNTVLAGIETQAQKSIKSNNVVMLRNGNAFEYINILNNFVDMGRTADKVTASATTVNAGDSPYAYTLLIATYENGTLKNISVKNDIAGAKNFRTTSLETTAAENCDVKGFVFDSMNGIKPLLPFKELKGASVNE